MSELSSSDTPAFLRRKARKLLKAAREGKPEALGQIGHQGVSETPLKLAEVGFAALL